MPNRIEVCKSLVLALGGGMALNGAPSVAQPAEQLDRVEITGSSIKRIEAEGALPVQTITRTDIDRIGVQTTEQLLATISAMSSSGQTQLATGAFTFTSGLSGVSLRGLGQERTLVLLNGRRLAPYASGGGTTVNVNAIPLAAIERVEILKDGASAIYGSDAIAGVVNFILVKNFEGVQIGGTVGTPTTSGGGQQYQANIVGGIGDLTQDRYNLTLSAQWEKNEQLFGRDRTFASNGNKPPYFTSGATGQGNIQGAWLLGSGPIDPGGAPYVAGSPGGGYGNPLATPDRCAEIRMFLSPGPTSQGKPYCQFDPAKFVGLTPQIETTSYTLNFVYKLEGNTELFADGIYTRNVVTQEVQPRTMRTDTLELDDHFAEQGVDPVLLVRTTNPAYKIASDYLKANGLGVLDGRDLGITVRAFDFGNRTFEDITTQQRLVVGLRGNVLGQDYNLGLGHNRSRDYYSAIDGYFSQVDFAKATQDPASDWNPWAATQSAAFNSTIAPFKYVGPIQDWTTSNTNFDATFSGPVYALPAGELQYAAGYQYRSEQYRGKYIPSPAFAPTEGIDESRSIQSLFGELQIPILRNLDLNLAGRHDSYSDFGSSNNYKASIRWQPMSSLLLRASYGTGFRAPTVSDLWTPQTSGISVPFNDPVTGLQDLQVSEVSGGNPNLKPETSKQGSFGIVYQPIASLTVGADYFNVTIENVVSTPSTQEVVVQNSLGNPAYAGLVIRDPLTNQVTQTKVILANTGRIEAQGWDISVRYRETLGPGRLDVTLNGTYYIKYDQGTPGAGTSHKVGTIVDDQGNPVIGADTGGVILRYKQYLAATWAQGGWATTLANQFADAYRGGWDLNGNPTRMPSLSLWDLQVAYGGVKNLTVALGARNILNQGPAIFVPVSGQAQAGYDPFQYDPRGRFVYLTGTYKF